MMPFASGMMMQPAISSPPSTDDPYFKNVALLMSFNGANGSTSFTDDSSFARTVSVFGDAQVSTAQSKFGGASLKLDGTGDYLTVPNDALWALGTQYFTIEAFVQFVVTTNDVALLSNWSSNVGFELSRSNFYNSLRTQIQNSNPAGGSWYPTAGQWYHVCFERGPTKWRTYIDGVMQGTGETGYQTIIVDPNSNALHIGARPGPGSMTACYMDELRFTLGVARYNSDSGFTVPTAPFPRTQATETGTWRFYKLKFTSANNAGGDILFREISVASSSGGTNIIRTCSVSGSPGGFSSAEWVAKATNGDTNDWWQPRISGGGSVEFVMDFHTKATLHEAILNPHPSYLTRTPAGVEVQGSNDGSTWTSIQTWTGLTTWSGTTTFSW